MLDWIHELVGDAPWLPALLWVVSIIVALSFLVRWVGKAWPKLRRFVKTMDSLAQLPEFMDKTTSTLEAQNEQIEQIHHEVHFNNGSSVKDATSRIESKVDTLTATVGEVQSKLANDNTRIIELQSRDELGRFTKKEE
jgi:hypothetical protein